MEVLVTLFSQLSTLFYAVCAIAGAYFLYTFVSAIREYQGAGYFLEKSFAREHVMGALMRLVFCLLAALAIYWVASLAPASTQESVQGGSLVTPNAAAARSPGAPPIAVIPRGTFTPVIIFAGQTPGAPATPGNGQGAPVIAAGGPNTLPINNCASAAAVIPGPVLAPGKVLTLTGTAVLENGGMFRVELLSPSGTTWMPLLEGRSSVTNASLVKAFNLQSFPAGTYGIKVTTFRADGAPAAVCQRSVALGT